MTDTPRQHRGFALFDPEVHRLCASAGGKAAHAKGGKGRKWTKEQASAAGKLGGAASAAKRALAREAAK